MNGLEQEGSLELTPRASALIRAYQELLRGELTPSALVARLKVASQVGVTEGTLAVIR